MEQIADTPSDQSTLLVYSFAALPSPIQVSTLLQMQITANVPAGGTATLCEQIVVTLPVGTNAADLIATAEISAVPPPGWKATQSGGQITFTPPDPTAPIKGGGLVFGITVTTNAQPGAANVLIDETASNRDNPMAIRSTTWAATKFPADFTLSALTTVPATATDIAFGSPAYLTWKATGAGVTCTLSYVPDDAGTQVSVAVPLTPDGPSFQTENLTRTGSVDFYLTANYPISGQDNPIPLQSHLPVTIEKMSLNVTVLPPTIPPGGIAMITWDAPNATRCVTKDGEVLPPSGTAYVTLQQTHDFEITAFGPNNQVKQAPTLVTVDPTIVATETGYSVTGVTGATIQPPAIAVDVTNPPSSGNPNGSGTVTIGGTVIPFQYNASGGITITVDGVTRAATQADFDALAAAMVVPSGPGGDGSFSMALPPLDLTGKPGRVIPISVTGGTGGTGGTGSIVFSGQSNSFTLPGPGCPGGQGGNANAVIAIDQTQTPAQYIFTFAVGAGGAGGPGQNNDEPGQQGPPGLLTALAFNGVVVPLDGTLVPPVPYEPLALTVTATPPTVPMNGLGLVRWNSPDADHCVLWDDTVVPPKGKRYIVLTATTDFTVTAYDQFGRKLLAGATITVDPSIQPTETGPSQTGAAGASGAAGACPSWVFNPNPPALPSGWTAGGPGGTGGNAAVSLAIPPLDNTGTSTRVISIAAVAGAGGPGGAGGWLIVTGLPSAFPDPFNAQFPQSAAAGGAGGNGGNATVTLTTDYSEPPARIILTAAAGAGGAGGESGFRVNLNGNADTAYASNGAAGTLTATINGLPIQVQPPA